jgi:hypothetical protein
MGIDYNNVIISDGLIFGIDAANPRSYTGSGITVDGLIAGLGATLVNGVAFSSLNNGSFTFDGTNDYLNFPYPSSLNSGSQITVSLWAKWITTGTTTATIQVLLDNNYQTAYQFGPGSIGFVIQDRPDLGKVLEWGASPGAGITRCTSTFQVGDGTWRHITGTNDGATSILYIDGVQSGLARTAAGIGDQQPFIGIGRWGFLNNRYLNGNVTGLMIYKRALSASEVLQNYNATKSRFRL